MGSALYGAGRKAAQNRIDGEINKQIELAAEEARLRIRSHTAQYLHAAWRSYLVSCATKLSLLCLLIVMVVFGVFPRPVGALLAGVFLAMGSAYDIFEHRGEIHQIWKQVRAHGLRVKRIIRTIVAKTVFEEVLSQAKEAKVSRLAGLVWAVSGYQRGDKYERLAKEVSVTASEVAWDDVRPFARVAALRFIGTILIYSGFAVSAVRWLTHP